MTTTFPVGYCDSMYAELCAQFSLSPTIELAACSDNLAMLRLVDHPSSLPCNPEQGSSAFQVQTRYHASQPAQIRSVDLVVAADTQHTHSDSDGCDGIDQASHSVHTCTNNYSHAAAATFDTQFPDASAHCCLTRSLIGKPRCMPQDGLARTYTCAWHSVDAGNPHHTMGNAWQTYGGPGWESNPTWSADCFYIQSTEQTATGPDIARAARLFDSLTRRGHFNMATFPASNTTANAIQQSVPPYVLEKLWII